jgi:hypothetical protein
MEVSVIRHIDPPGSMTIRVRRGARRVTVYHSMAELPADVRQFLERSDAEFAAARRKKVASNEERIRKGRFHRLRSGPGGIRVKETRSHLKIVYPWFSWAAVFVLGGVLPLWGWSSWQILTALPKRVAWPIIAIGSFFLVVWVLIFYACLAHLMNRTIIEIGRKKLTLRHGPLPWFGRKTLRNAEVVQLYASYCRGRNQSIQHYLLYAIMADGRHVRLLDEIPQLDQAAYLVKQMEERLGIEPSPGLSDWIRDAR